MAIRFFGDFQNDVGDHYRINIHDSGFTGVASEVTLGVPGFVLKYEGDNQDEYQPIIPSSLSFTVYNQGGDFDTWLNTDIPAAAEGAFLVDVFTADQPIAQAADETLYWRGTLLTEQIQQADEPTPTAVELRAADGLGMLQRLEHDDLAQSVSTGSTILIVWYILSEVRYHSLYASDDSFLRYFNDFKSEGFTGSDYLASSSLSYPSVPGVAPTKRYRPYDVLRSIALAFNARIFQAQGIFYFLPINKFQQRIDADTSNFLASMFELGADGSANTLTSADKVNFYLGMAKSSAQFIKMAGNIIEYSRPVKRVVRTRETLASEFLIQANTGFTTLATGADDLSVADDDRLYFEDSTFLVQLAYNIDIASVASENNFVNFHTIVADFTIKFGDQYYTDTGWTGTAGTKRVVIGQYYKSFGFEEIADLTLQVPELSEDEAGVDLTLDVKVLNGAGGDITGSLPTHNVNFTVRLFPGTNDESPGDNLTFASESDLDNSVILDQGTVLVGNAAVYYGANSVIWNNGSITSNGNDNSFVSSQTSTGFPMMRLAVREVLYNMQLPHRIRQGNIYIQNSEQQLWPYHILQEDLQFHVILEMSYNANANEYTIERYQKNQSTTNISFRTDEVRRNDPRGRFAISGPQGFANSINSNFEDSVKNTFAQFYQIIEITAASGVTYQVDDNDNNGYIFMVSYTGANGTGNIVLPKVGENEGRLLRFKTDGTISANGNVAIRMTTEDRLAGTLIDGRSDYTMDRPYDGITLLCHDSQWFIIQKKEK